MSHGFIEVNEVVDTGHTVSLAVQIVHIIAIKQLPVSAGMACCLIVDRFGGQHVVSERYGEVMRLVQIARDTRSFAPPRASAPAGVGR